MAASGGRCRVAQVYSKTPIAPAPAICQLARTTFPLSAPHPRSSSDYLQAGDITESNMARFSGEVPGRKRRRNIRQVRKREDKRRTLLRALPPIMSLPRADAQPGEAVAGVGRVLQPFAPPVWNLLVPLCLLVRSLQDALHAYIGMRVCSQTKICARTHEGLERECTSLRALAMTLMRVTSLSLFAFESVFAFAALVSTLLPCSRACSLHTNPYGK